MHTLRYWVYSWQKQIFILSGHQWEWDLSLTVFHVWRLEDFPQTSFWRHTCQALFLSTTSIILEAGSHRLLGQIVFSKMDATRSPIPHALLVMGYWHSSHWGMGSVLLPLEPEWIWDYGRSDTMWLPRLGPGKWYSFCLALLGHLALEPSHHVMRKPRPQPAEVPANSQHTLPDMWVRHLQMIPAPRLQATPADTTWSCDKLPHPVADLWAKQMIAVVLSQQLKVWGDLLCRRRHPGHTQLYRETTPGTYHQVTIRGKSAQRERSQRPFLLCHVWGLARTLCGSGGE